jgi:hypothetical protein
LIKLKGQAAAITDRVFQERHLTKGLGTEAKALRGLAAMVLRRKKKV